MKIFQISILVLAVTLVSCKKAELKKPTTVNFAFDLNKSFNESSAVKLVSGEINLGKFNISGDRIEGDDIAFTRSFSSGLRIDINGSGEIAELDYDLPQGEYKEIKLDFSAKEDGGEPSLLLNGHYKRTDESTVGLRFEFFVNQDFLIVGHDKDLNSTIVMDKSHAKKVKVELDPIYWFESLSANQLDNADVESLQGQDVIIISPMNNVNLYDIVSNRISMSNTAEFK